MKLSDLLRHLPTVLEQVGGDVEITGVRADSRRVQPGDLFIAVPGLNVDGHRFIGQAVGKGAVAVIGELPSEELRQRVRPAQPSDFAYVRVPDSREAWGWACAGWEGLPSRDLTLVGVTGTDGKTTTVSLIHSILNASGIRAGMVSTVNALIPAAAGGERAETVVETGLHTTTPDPPDIQSLLAQMVAGGATHTVLEVTSHGLAQHRVAGCDFDVAVLTNITREHLDFHRSFAAYRRTKARLFKGLSDSFRKPGVRKTCVLNGDDPSLQLLSSCCPGSPVVYALDRDADVTACDLELGREETRFRLCAPTGSAAVQTSLVGRYNVRNILAAASAGVALGIALGDITKGVASVRGVSGRMERIEAGQDYLAIVDFAHTANALEQALKTARPMVAPGGALVAVFGSAGLRDPEKRVAMGRAAGRLADVVIVTAEDPRTESLEAIMAEIASAAESEGKREGVDLFQIQDRGRAILRACEIARAGDVVIACGKGHEESMCFGTTEYPWDDRRAMRLAVHGQTLDTLPTARHEK